MLVGKDFLDEFSGLLSETQVEFVLLEVDEVLGGSKNVVFEFLEDDLRMIRRGCNLRVLFLH